MSNTKAYPQLPDLDTLIRQRRTHTLKQLAEMYNIPASTLDNRLSKALVLMGESKRRAWAAWEAKRR